MSHHPCRTLLAVVGIPATAILGGGCGDGDEGPALAMAQLSEASDCPVDLGGALAGADLAVDGAETTVEVSEGTGTGGAAASALDQGGGVHVSCTYAAPSSGSQEQDGGGDGGAGQATAVLYATDEDHAVNLLLPQMQRDLQLGTADMRDIVASASDTDEGELVDLGVDAPAAVAGVDVEGAESAALYVTRPGAEPEQVRAAAESLLDEV